MDNDFDDIPGTYVFDTKRCKEGFHLNKFCKSLDQANNRDKFRADPIAYLEQYPMTAEQRQMIDDRNWLGMLQLGGNIYYTFKLAIFDGLTMQHVGGMMSDMTVDEFKAMMLEGGRNLEGNQSKKQNQTGR
ncbi:MAG: protocatechuate 4,5-dioxygenase subunit alpha [Granulosicoccaceae bacterium]